MLGSNNKVKLSDFGCMRSTLKPRDTCWGTLFYMAPEMVNREKHDEQVDIWLLGILLYEFLTG